MLCVRFSDIESPRGWKYVVRPFEASLREAPQDEALLMPSTAFLMLRGGRESGRLEARRAPMQPIILVGCHGPDCSFHGIVTALLHAYCIIDL